MVLQSEFTSWVYGIFTNLRKVSSLTTLIINTVKQIQFICNVFQTGEIYVIYVAKYTATILNLLTQFNVVAITAAIVHKNLQLGGMTNMGSKLLLPSVLSTSGFHSGQFRDCITF